MANLGFGVNARACVQLGIGPVLVLRALKLSGGMFRVDGGMAELDWLLDEETFDPVAEATYWRVGEVFVDRIEPAETTTDISVPTGYEENGIWVRGDEGRTASRAIERWRKIRGESAGRLVSVRDIRISRKQPRPIPPKGLNS